MRLLRSGDRSASGGFAVFVDKYNKTVFLCCRKLGPAELGTRLWGIAYRQAISFLRKNRRVQQLADDGSDAAVGLGRGGS